MTETPVFASVLAELVGVFEALELAEADSAVLTVVNEDLLSEVELLREEVGSLSSQNFRQQEGLESALADNARLLDEITGQLKENNSLYSQLSVLEEELAAAAEENSCLITHQLALEEELAGTLICVRNMEVQVAKLQQTADFLEDEIQRPLYGADRPNRPKLPLEAVQEIRRLFEAGWPQNKLAGQFGVNPSTISRIVSGTYHKDADNESVDTW
jgi:DNA transposition AAA+ family ATPase